MPNTSRVSLAVSIVSNISKLPDIGLLEISNHLMDFTNTEVFIKLTAPELRGVLVVIESLKTYSTKETEQPIADMIDLHDQHG